MSLDVKSVLPLELLQHPFLKHLLWFAQSAKGLWSEYIQPQDLYSKAEVGEENEHQ